MFKTPRRHLVRLSLSTAIIALCSTPALSAELSGFVTDGAQHYPLGGAKVTITQLGQSVTSARDGSYRFTNIPAGTYTIKIDYLGTPSLQKTVTLSAQGQTQSFALNAAKDEIIVVGQRGTMLSSLNQQRNADNLKNVITSDSIGQFPDQNVTEAARRVSGISVENDQGEGRFIVIRGVDPNLNSTSINGVRIPSPEGDVRATALDVIDSEVLQSIEITKSLTADLDGDGIGGNIEIKTVSAFDRKGRYLKAKAAGSYNKQVEEFSPKVSVSASDIFADGKLGLALTASYRQRKFGSEGIEVDGGFINNLFPKEYEMRDYQVTRERINLAANVDYHLGDTTKLFLRTLYSDFTDEEFRSRVEIKPNKKKLTGQNGSVLDFSEGKVDRDSKDRTESQKIWSISAGGVTDINQWNFDYSASLSHAEEKESNRLDVDYRLKGKGLTVDIANPLRPLITFIDTDYTDATAFKLDKAEVLDGITQDKEVALALNIRRDMNFGANPSYIKFGGKLRMRDKTRDVDLTSYDGDGAFTLDAVQGNVDYGLGDIGPVIDRGLVRTLINTNIGNLDINADDTFIESNLADYTAKEDITAGYFMFGTEISDLKLIAGVRIENTDYEGLGRDVRLFAKDSALDLTSVPSGAECRDKDGNLLTPVTGVLGDDLICITDARNSDTYTDVLPSIILKLDATDNLVLRASYYKSLARPNFKSIVPSANINQNDDNEFQGEFGNITAFGIPKLEHQIANSFDLSAEYYTDNGGVISAGIFHKNFNNFISELKARDFVTSFAIFDEAIYSVNLDDANLTGIELNLQQPLDFLPGVMSGLIFGANYTYIDGEATNLNGQKIALPKQSSNIGNLVLGYDKYGFDTRIALSYRDAYLDEVDGRTVDAHTQIDVSAKYKINDNFQIFGDITNITDEPFVAYDRDGERKLLNQLETYGRTFEMGLRYKY